MKFGPIMAGVSAALSLTMTPAQGLACSCLQPGPACQAAWTADAIFTGTVRSIVPMEEVDADGNLRSASLVTFDIMESFLNVKGPVAIVSSSLNTCDYGFSAGGQYLVYARKSSDSRFRADICSRTRPLSDAQKDDLPYLRSIRRLTARTRVYGRITESIRHPAEPHPVDNGPLADVSVHVFGPSFSYAGVTDRDGRYEIPDVPLGKLEIAVDAPFGARAYGPTTGEIANRRGCVQADFVVAAEATATGIVLDQSGRPVAGIVVDAVAAELAGYQPEPYHRPATTDRRGVFTFEQLPAGEYVFGVNLTKTRTLPAAGPQVFLPGTARAHDAAVIALEPGDRKDVGVLRLTVR